MTTAQKRMKRYQVIEAKHGTTRTETVLLETTFLPKAVQVHNAAEDGIPPFDGQTLITVFIRHLGEV